MTNFSTQKERILQFIDYKGISKNKFYIETGISNGILDKKSGLSMETVEKFYSTYPEINAEWLLTGNGSMLKNEVKNDVQPANNSEVEALLREKVALLEENKALLQAENERLKAEIQALKSVQSVAVNQSNQPSQSQPLIQPSR